jgi:hypothetical protein
MQAQPAPAPLPLNSPKPASPTLRHGVTAMSGPAKDGRGTLCMGNPCVLDSRWMKHDDEPQGCAPITSLEAQDCRHLLRFLGFDLPTLRSRIHRVRAAALYLMYPLG